MLGFAFSEAQRSQELMRRLQHQQKSSGEGVSPTGAMTDKATEGRGHKRTRRRRRSKKTHGGASVGSSTASSSTGGMSGYIVGNLSSTPATIKRQPDTPMTRRDLYFSLRCGMVHVGPRPMDTAVGRVTLVNWDNEIVVDTFVKVPRQITNYRTDVTGITPGLLERGASSLDSVRKKVGALIRGKILVGHGLEVDLACLRLSHPWCDIRDTATYAPYMQQVVDPSTRLILPRSLDDLMHNVLHQQPLKANPAQPVLVSEAIACLSLYKAVRQNWEAELVKAIQQKERQHEMVVNMRSVPNALSRIAEDVSGDEAPGSPVVPVHRLSELGMITRTEPPQLYIREYNEFETSTSTSDQTTLENYEIYRDDDVSETSSFVTNESEADLVSSRHQRNHELEASLNPLFENLHLLKGYDQFSRHNPFSTTGSSTAPGSHHVEEWTQRESLGTSHNSGIWSPLPSKSAVNSIRKMDWSHDLPRATSDSKPGDSGASRVQPLSVPLTEAELREHLPTHLLDDLDAHLECAEVQHELPNEVDEPKKKPWFRFGRRIRSLSASPPSHESFFNEMKAGLRLSLSDGLLPRRRSPLLEDELHDDDDDEHPSIPPPPDFLES